MDFYNAKSSPSEGLAITGLSTIEEKNKVTINMLLIQIILIVNTEQIEYSFIISLKCTLPLFSTSYYFLQLKYRHDRDNLSQERSSHQH